MIVIDASVVVEVLLQSPETQAIEQRIFGTGVDLHAPHLVEVEVAQVLRRFVHRRRIGAAAGRSMLDVLVDFPLTRHGHRELIARAWSLRENLTVYDSMYVALAEILDAPLLTRDRRLANAAGVRASIEIV